MADRRDGSLDLEDLDLVTPAHLTLEANGLGDLELLAIGADVDYRLTERDGRPAVEFSFDGVDEGDRICGRGWAILEGGELRGRLFIHRGDESAFIARREQEESLDLDRLVDVLRRRGIHARIPEAVAFTRARQGFLGIHDPCGTPVDVSLAWLPFEEEGLRESHVCDFAGIPVRSPRPEDLLIYKPIASRPQDVDDAESLLVLHGAPMNLGRVRTVVRQFAAALDDEERPETLERLVLKVGLERR